MEDEKDGVREVEGEEKEGRRGRGSEKRGERGEELQGRLISVHDPSEE